MSDSNSNHTVVLDDNVPLPSVIRTISQTLNAEVEEDNVIPQKKKGDGTPAITSMNTPTTPLFKDPM